MTKATVASPQSSRSGERSFHGNFDLISGSGVTLQSIASSTLGMEIARHDERRGRRERVLDPAHPIGVIANDRGSPVTSERELLRPLAEYEQIAGAGW